MVKAKDIWERKHTAPSKEQIEKALDLAHRVTVEMAAQAERELFAERLRTLRNNAGLTQYQLADKADIDRTLITRYETGKTMPRPKAIEKLAAALDVAPAALDVSAGSVSVVDTALLRKHGYKARKVQQGLYAVAIPGCPEITITEQEAERIWEHCAEETNKVFYESMENYFVHLFILEAYAECSAPDPDQAQPKK